MVFIKLSLVLISAGIVLMLFAVVKTKTILTILKDKLERTSWGVLYFLMLVFIGVYVASMYIILQRDQEILSLLIGMVFLFKAMFLFIATRVSSHTINDLINKDKSQELTIELKGSDAIIKQKSDALEIVNKELEEERTQLETRVEQRTAELKASNVKLQNVIEDHEKLQRELGQNKNRLEMQNEAMHKITKCFVSSNPNISNAILEVTEIASHTIKTERVSVWLFDESKTTLRCFDLYENSKNKHSDGVTLSSENYPVYFKVIQSERVIAANDAPNDPRTKEYKETYLNPLGITSLLDAPVRKAGEMVGIVCFEHVGSPRNWTGDEQLFAAAIADSISILLESVERIVAEKALMQKEQQLSTIYNSVGDTIFVLSPEKAGKYKFVSINKTFETTTGLTYDYVVGKYVDEIIPQPLLSTVLEKYKKAILDKKTVCWEGLFDYPSGQIIGEVSVSPIFDEAGTCKLLVGALHDITEQKNVEKKIRKLSVEMEDKVKERTADLFLSNQNLTTENLQRKKVEKQLGEKASLLQAIFDSSVAGILSVNNKGEIITTNKRFQKLWSIPDEIMATKDDNKLLEFVLAQLEEPEVFIKKVNELYEQPTIESFDVLKFKDGKVFERYSMPEKLKGEVVGRVWNFIDVTDQKKTEGIIKQKSEELARTNKELAHINKELEQFVYVASHDLQEPLRTISNFSGLIINKYSGKLDTDAVQYMNYIVSGTSKMQNLIKDLLEFSRVGRNVTFASVNLNNILKEVITDMNSSIQDSKAIISNEILPIIKGSEIKLKQLFQNLISNAIKFSKKNVIPEIQISVKEFETEYLFSIKDNGIGIEQQNIGKLFVFFKRLNNATEYPGTGIGLAICNKIIMLHNGKIWVESKLGEGSTFYFILPKKNN